MRCLSATKSVLVSFAKNVDTYFVRGDLGAHVESLLSPSNLAVLSCGITKYGIKVSSPILAAGIDFLRESIDWLHDW